MNLIEVKQYLSHVKMASLANLCAYFNCESDYLRQMLSHWVQKDCVRQCKKTPNCGVKCGQCSPLVTEIYEWVV